MNVLIATDSFKGSLRSHEVCTIIARVAREFGHVPLSVPMADGGEGSLEAIGYATSFKRIDLRVQGPDFQEIDAYYLLDNFSRTAYIELAVASGIELINVQQTNCLHTTTLGTGQLIRHAIEQGIQRVVLFVGGSATNDAAMGILSALGFRFTDKYGHTLKPIGSQLAQVAEVYHDEPELTEAIEFVVATDVDNPFYGPSGAAYVYGPQKGADPEAIKLLDEGLRNFAHHIYLTNRENIQLIPGTGAAGGVGGGLVGLLGAKLLPGAELIFEATGIEANMQHTKLLITGEGRTDKQTLRGKLVQKLLKLAQNHQIETLLLCGQFRGDEQLQTQLGATHLIQLAETPEQTPYAMAHPAELITQKLRQFFENRKSG